MFQLNVNEGYRLIIILFIFAYQCIHSIIIMVHDCAGLDPGGFWGCALEFGVDGDKKEGISNATFLAGDVDVCAL